MSALDALRAVILGVVGRRLDYLALYPARVVAQSGAALDLHPDDARIPPCAGVPIRHGLPGVAVTVAAGERVLLGYAGGDPAAPYAALWEAGNVTAVSFNGSTRQLARTDDTTANGKLVFSPTGSFVGYVAPGGVDVPTPPGGSIATLSGVVTGTSVVRA